MNVDQYLNQVADRHDKGMTTLEDIPTVLNIARNLVEAIKIHEQAAYKSIENATPHIAHEKTARKAIENAAVFVSAAQQEIQKATQVKVPDASPKPEEALQ